MDLPLPEEVQAQLATFEELLGSLEDKLQPFLGPRRASSIAQLPPLELAKAQLALAQATAALYGLYLRASGVDPQEHESKKEQERLVQYNKKVRKAAAAKELRESRRSMEVNVAAVNRFITAAVPDLTVEQRAALKQAAGGTRRPAGGGEAPAADEEEAAGAAAAFLEGLEPGQGAATTPETAASTPEGPAGSSSQKKKRRRQG